MAVYLCHEQPDLVEHDARRRRRPSGTSAARPLGIPSRRRGAGERRRLDRVRRWCRRHHRRRDAATDAGDEQMWHLLGDDYRRAVRNGRWCASTPSGERGSPSLHTDSHILNALVFDRVPGHARDRSADQRRRHRADGLRPVADRQRRAARARRRSQRGHRRRCRRAQRLRRRPPRPTRPPGSSAASRSRRRRHRTAQLRVIDIDGVDRQACGGTHLSNTAQSAPFRITKVENKGKRNRRIRFELA